MNIAQPDPQRPPTEFLASFATLLIGLLLAAFFIHSAYLDEQEAERREVLAGAAVHAEKVAAALQHLVDTTLQITSRTRIREELDRYLRGERSLASIQAFTEPKLADPMRLRRDILGIERIAADGAPIARLGELLPPDTWAGFAEPPPGPQVRFGLPGVPRIVVRAPIVAPDDRALGADSLLFDDEFLRHTIDLLLRAHVGVDTGLIVTGTDARREFHFLRQRSVPGTAGFAQRHLEQLLQQAGAAPAYVAGDPAAFVIDIPFRAVPMQIVLLADPERFHAGARTSAYRAAVASTLLVAAAALALFVLLRRLNRSLHALQARNIDLGKQAKEQRRLMEQIIDNTPSVIYVKDPDGRYQLVNRAFEKLLGRPRAELVGLSDADVFPADTANQFRKNDLLLMGRGEAREFDERVETADGVRYYLSVKFPQRDASGNAVGICGISTDITDRRNSEVRLQAAAAIFEQAREGMLIVSPEGDILDINPAMCRLMGGKPEDFLGNNPRIWKSDRHTEEFYRALWEQSQKTGHWRGEIWNRPRGRHERPFLLSISAVRDEQGNILRYVANYTDISAQIDAQQQMEFLAHHDPLTGLPNRAKFSIQVEMVMARALRNRNSFALAYLDLDGFKPINDEFGHDAGDVVLRLAGERLRGAVRGTDAVARVGGDEFTLLFEDVANRSSITGLLDKIIEAFATPFVVDGVEVCTTPSVGVSIFPEDGDSVAALLRTADEAMYRAKSAGRNRYVFYSEGISDPNE